jgi:hypothetical protein
MDCDQIIYIGIFLLIGLIVYRQMCKTGRHRIPRAAWSFEAMDIGTGEDGGMPGENSDFNGTNIKGRQGNNSLITGGEGGDSVGGCPVNVRRQQENAETWDMSSNKNRSEEDVEMNESYRTVDYSQMGMNTDDQLNKSCFPQTILSSKDLLPGNIKADISKFKEEASKNIGQGILEGISYLDSGFHVGVNTVGQSLRNANRQLRSEPPNPQVAVSPWLMSSIGPDLERKPIDGSSCSA